MLVYLLKNNFLMYSNFIIMIDKIKYTLLLSLYLVELNKNI